MTDVALWWQSHYHRYLDLLEIHHELGPGVLHHARVGLYGCLRLEDGPDSDWDLPPDDRNRLTWVDYGYHTPSGGFSRVHQSPRSAGAHSHLSAAVSIPGVLSECSRLALEWIRDVH